MATSFGSRWTIDWTTPTADCRLWIKQAGYAGGSTALDPAPTPISIRWGEQGRDDLTSPLRISTARIRFIGDSAGEMVEEVFDGGDTEYLVKFWRDAQRDGSYELEWEGYLATDLWRDNPHLPAEVVELEAIDGLALLENRQAFTQVGSNDPYEFYRLSQALRNVLRGWDPALDSPADAPLHDLPITTSQNWRPNSLTLTNPSTDQPFDELHIYNTAFQELDDLREPTGTLDQRTQLEGILERFGLTLMLSGGEWRLRQRDQIDDGTSLKTWTMPEGGSFFGSSTTSDVTTDLPAAARTEKPRSRASRLQRLKSSYSYDDLGQLVVNEGFEEPLSTGWTVFGTANRKKYSNSSIISTASQYFLNMGNGSFEQPDGQEGSFVKQNVPARFYDAGPGSALEVKWDLLLDNDGVGYGNAETRIGLGDYYAQARRIQIKTDVEPGKDATIRLKSPLPGAEGTVIIPEGMTVRTGDPSSDENENSITLTEPGRAGDESLTADVDVGSTIKAGDFALFFVWSDTTTTGFEGTREYYGLLNDVLDYPSKLDSHNTLNPQSLRMPLHTPQGIDLVDEDLSIAFWCDDSSDSSIDWNLIVDNISVQLLVGGDAIEETRYIADSGNYGREQTLNHRIGDGPTAKHPRGIFDASGQQIFTDWGQEAGQGQTGKLLEQLTVEQWMRQQRDTLDRRTYECELRGSDSLKPHHVVGFDSKTYTVSYLQRQYGTGGDSGRVELTEKVDSGVDGLTRAFSMESETGSGGGGGTTIINSGNQTIQGASSWGELTGKPSGLFSSNGDSDGFAETQALGSSDIPQLSASKLSDVSPDSTSDAHHAKYTDSNAVSAVESAGTIDLTSTTLKWHQDTDSARLKFIDYGDDKDYLTLTVKDNNGDAFRIRHEDTDDNIVNVADFDRNGLELPRGLTISGNTVSPDSDADAHHAKYTDSDAVSAIESAKLSSLQLDNQEFQSSDSDGKGTLLFDKSAGMAYYNDASNAPGSNTGFHRILDTGVLSTGDDLNLSQNGTEGQVGLSFVGDVSWTLEEGDGEQTTIGGGEKLEVFGGTDLSTEIVSTGSETRLRVRHSNTSGASNASAGSSQVIDGVNVDGRGHVTGFSTTGRHITEWNNAKADLDPNTAYEHNIGAASKKWLTLHAAELRVANLVSADELITQGGRQIVGTSTELIEAIGSGASSIKVKHNNLSNGDWLHLEARGNYEAMKVTSQIGPVDGGHEYGVSRNEDGTGADAWEAGDAVWNRGSSAGYGFIDQYAVEAHVDDTTASGPSTAYMYRYGPSRNDVEPRALSGNLSGFYGYNSDTFGFAAGRPSGEHITVEGSNGLRIQDGSGNTAAQLSGSSFSIGSLFYDAATDTLTIGGTGSGDLESVSGAQTKADNAESSAESYADGLDSSLRTDLNNALDNAIANGTTIISGGFLKNDFIQTSTIAVGDFDDDGSYTTPSEAQSKADTAESNAKGFAESISGRTAGQNVDNWNTYVSVDTGRDLVSGFSVKVDQGNNRVWVRQVGQSGSSEKFTFQLEVYGATVTGFTDQQFNNTISEKTDGSGNTAEVDFQNDNSVWGTNGVIHDEGTNGTGGEDEGYITLDQLDGNVVLRLKLTEFTANGETRYVSLGDRVVETDPAIPFEVKFNPVAAGDLVDSLQSSIDSAFDDAIKNGTTVIENGYLKNSFIQTGTIAVGDFSDDGSYTTPSEAQSKADTAESNAESYADGLDSSLRTDLNNALDDAIANGTTIITGGYLKNDFIQTSTIAVGDFDDDGTYETPSGAQSKADNAESNAESYADSITGDIAGLDQIQSTTYIQDGLIDTGLLAADAVTATKIKASAIAVGNFKDDGTYADPSDLFSGDWGDIDDPDNNKPADNADVTANNTASAISGQGDFATEDAITDSNNTTLINDGAIVTDNIAADAITASKLAIGVESWSDNPYSGYSDRPYNKTLGFVVKNGILHLGALNGTDSSGNIDTTNLGYKIRVTVVDPRSEGGATIDSGASNTNSSEFNGSGDTLNHNSSTEVVYTGSHSSGSDDAEIHFSGFDPAFTRLKIEVKEWSVDGGLSYGIHAGSRMVESGTVGDGSPSDPANISSSSPYTLVYDPYGTIVSGSNIVTGSITANRIASNAVNADKINVGSLSSISDDVGVLVSGKLQDSASNPDTVLDFTNNNMKLDSVTLTGSITTGAESLGGWTVGNDTIQSAPTGSNDVNEMVLDGTEGILQITDSSNTGNVLAIGNINFGQSIAKTVDPWYAPDESSSCDISTDRCIDQGFGSCDNPPYVATCDDPGPNSYNTDSDYYFGAKVNVTYRISYDLTTSTSATPSDEGNASATADAYAKIQLRDGSDNILKEKSQSISGNSSNSGTFEISTSDSSLEHVRVEVGTQTTADASDPTEGYFQSQASSSADASTGALQELGGTNEFISSKGLSFNKGQTAPERVGIKRNGEWPAIGGAILVGEWELVQDSNDNLVAHHPPSNTETTLATSS